jgi:hypothetical protein
VFGGKRHESLLEDIWAESWKKEYIRLGAISSTTSFRHAATHANVYKWYMKNVFD